MLHALHAGVRHVDLDYSWAKIIEDVLAKKNYV